MAIITNDTITNTQAHAMGSRHGHALGRPTLRHKRIWHARARPVPSPPFFTGLPYPQFVLNRMLQRAAGLAWTKTLTGGQRTAWEALAAAQPITKDDGTAPTVSGIQFFLWFQLTNYWQWISIGEKFALALNTWVRDPPPVWSPPHAPFNLAVASIGPTFITINFDSDPNLTGNAGAVLTRTFSNARPKPKKKSFIRTVVEYAENSPASVHYQYFVYPDGALRSIQDFSGNDLILRIGSNDIYMTPSAPAFLTLPVF